MSSLLEVEGLHAGYGMFTVLHGVSLHVEAGEIVALVGSNGAGKTTCMRAVAGLLSPRAGRVSFDGNLMQDANAPQRVGAGLVYVPEGRELFPGLTVLDNLLVGAASRRARTARAQSLENVFALFPKLRERQRQICSTMSGGEQQMVAIGRGLMALPRMLLLDEPSLGLAPTIVKQLFRAIEEIRQRGIAVLMVEQNVRSVLKIADRAYVIENGRVKMEGRSQELASDPKIVEAYFGVGSKEHV